MAVSRFAYVRSYEAPDAVLPNTYMVVRLDGKGFHAFSTLHGFAKPNDVRALELANRAAQTVLEKLRPEVTLAFGESDEYSFLLRRSCALYSRRASKLLTYITSLFTAAYVSYWPRYFGDAPMLDLPIFDGRLVVYPTEREVRDYFAWRGADTHINNLYNTTFWALVLQGGHTEREAHEILKGSVSADKNEILFSRFGINYDRLPAMFRKGTTLAWAPREEGKKGKLECRTLHVDVVGKIFWEEPKEKRAAGRVPITTAADADAADKEMAPSSEETSATADAQSEPAAADAPPTSGATSSSAPPSTTPASSSSALQDTASLLQEHFNPRRTQGAAGLGWRALRA